MAAKLAEALEVSLDYLVGNSDLKFDKETINRIVDIQNLNDEDKHPLLKLVDAYLRDVKTKKAYLV